MSPDRTRAVALRVLGQLRRDRRTLALVFGVPVLLLWLTSEVYSQEPGVFDRVGPLMLGLFPFTILFVITSIAVLRERTLGTLERLMASPIGRGDLLGGYAIAFTVVALVQTGLTMLVGLWPLDLPNRGALWLSVVVVIGLALLGIALGLFLSAFARNEFQAVQFLPAVILPQFFLAGILVPLAAMPHWLRIIARLLPLTYAFEALDRIMLRGYGPGDGRVLLDLVVIFGAVLALLVAGSLTLRRTED